jgi:hypothetical protein
MLQQWLDPCQVRGRHVASSNVILSLSLPRTHASVILHELSNRHRYLAL